MYLLTIFVLMDDDSSQLLAISSTEYVFLIRVEPSDTPPYVVGDVQTTRGGCEIDCRLVTK
jgi:hypothetical protein